MKISEALLGFGALALRALPSSAPLQSMRSSEGHLHRRYEIAAEAVVLPTDAEAVARGAHVAIVRGCTSCHGEDLGGTVFIDERRCSGISIRRI